MSQETVRVVARIVALPTKVEEVKSILCGIIEPTRKESGCIQYELQQNHQDPTDFVFVEEWESDALLDAHLASALLEATGSKLDGLLTVSPDIRRYRLVA